MLRLRRINAPVEASFSDWAAEQLGDESTAKCISNFMGVATFDYDPGRLSAAFVQERLRRATQFPSPVRYIEGSWGTLVQGLADHARSLGVRIETNSPVDHLPPAPVILAVQLSRAAELLGDESLDWSGTRTALLDVGMKKRRRDPFIISDLDSSGWAEIYSRPEPSVAPVGDELLQSQAGLLPGESLEDGVVRLESLLDTAFVGWRERETWRRRLIVENESGALDLPGTMWRDRPRSDRGDGVYVVGDMVSAPGLLSEVTFNSAVASVAGLSEGRPLSRVA